ncbi:MAG: SpaH/EbpB family LPXTG-anchored major pilin, partial [Clostridia bacterium]|nr:SpaH/EbpB family LPXTG-anchored major pilin [Clostridia bacterium]
MKALKKTFAIILLAIIIYTSAFAGFKINNSIAANLTGNNAYISLAWERYKIGGFWTYIKNGVRSLDLYCVQHGAPLDSWSNYLYSEASWDNQAGIFKNEDSYKKLTWIKENFWEKTNASEGSKYTPEEKVKILNLIDKSITVNDVNAVFNSSTEKFKLYQTISWNYVNNYASTYYSLKGSTDKVYKAIIGLADKYYNVAQTLKLEETSNIVANENGTYTWGMKTTNTYALPYSHKLLVDGKEWENYTYSNNVINISNVGTGKHTFRFLVSTYKVSSNASIWLNNSKQNMLDITSTKKERKEASKEATLVHEVKEPGYFTLKIKKEDNKGNPLKDVNFSVNNKTYTSNNNGEAIIIDETNKVEIDETDKVYEYTVEELSDNLNGYSRLKDPVTIELKSAVRGENGKLIYYLRSANFKENGMNEIEVESENGKKVKLKLSLSNNGNITNVTVTVPNVEKTFDLALTKTIVTPQTEIIEKYDFNYDGRVNSSDASMVQVILNRVLKSSEEPIKIIRNTLNEVYKEIYTKYYETLEDELILFKFDLNGDGKISSQDYSMSSKIQQIYAEQSVGKDIDRIHGVDSENLNKNNETTSKYNMNKSVKKVRKNDIITYKINVYNEGDYNAEDIEVTDYIPQGLVVCDENGNTELNDNKIVCSYNGINYTWTIDGKIAKTTINKEIQAFDGKTLRNEKVYITCKLEDSVQAGDILYNVAEITNAKATEKDGTIVKTQGEDIEDRDSFKDTVKGNNEVQDLIDNYKDRFIEELDGENDEYVDKSIYNYEDDDDFERIVISDEKEFDLALRKSISKIGNSFENMKETQNRLPEINDITVSNCKKTGTGAYYHNKEALKVKVGDYVEYTIRIYNEGSIVDYNGYAKQITDYLPDGMEFEAIVNKDGNWISTENNGKYITEKNGYGGYELTYDKTNNKVIIDCIDTPALNTKNNLNTVNNLYKSKAKINGYYTSDEFKSATSYAYQEVKIICKVTKSAKQEYLTNVAEITDSVAIVDGNEDEIIKDRDSIAKNIEITKEVSNVNKKKINLDTYYKEKNVDDTYKPYYPGIEDDDDFETVLVERIPGTPEIHKGVKNILNQDSGYNGDEEHDWVINTTIPEEMNMFTKYIVTDTTDERLVFSGIEKVTVKIGNKQLIKDTDYKINYDEKTRTIKISFIEGDFVAGKSFDENGVIEIRFKTTFAKDKQGNIIAINQEVPNQATLIYDNGSGKEEEKKSEKPEVHTGAVAVYKYNEETKVALEGAKFKIATSKENAEKGIFVKDANGKDLEAISNSKGIATFTGLEFGGDAINNESNKKEDGTYSYDFEKAKKTYYIVETEAPEGFNKHEGVIEVTLSKNTTLTEIKDMKSIANTPIGEFDLALRKFITGVTNGYGNKQEVTTRKPVFKI